MKLSHLILILGYTLITGCTTEINEKAIETITISTDNITTLSYDKYVKEYSIIPLYTDSDNYLGAIDRLYIQNNRIGILSRGKVFIYSSNDGTLLSVIDKKGRGPGEYQAIDDIYLDDAFVYVLDRLARKILKYDLEGRYMDMINTQLIGYAFTRLDLDNFAIYINSDKNDKSEYRLNFYSIKNKRIVDKIFKISDSEYKWQYVDDLRNFIRCNDTTYFTYSFNDTIYRIEGNVLNPMYYVDFGKNKTPKQFINKNYSDIMEFSKKAAQNGYIYSISGFHHTNDYIYFGFNFNNKFIHCIYSLKSRRSLIFNKISNYLDVTGLVEETDYYNFPLYNDDNYFYALIEPNLLREKLREKQAFCTEFVKPILNSHEGDNPFLLKFKLKGL